MRHNIEIERYRKEMAEEWDRFVSRSRQPSFLLSRGYMDYHGDRFADYSLVARQGGRIVGLLPAERREERGRGEGGERRKEIGEGDRYVVSSHRGLTYGGWITPVRHFDGAKMLEMFGKAVEFMRADGVKRLEYTPIPHIYTIQPAEEDIYALARMGARMTACGLSSAISLRSPAPTNESTRQAVRLAMRHGVEVTESEDLSGFWLMLEECLSERHGVRPTHNLYEMSLLKERFPDNIKLFIAKEGGEPVAGTVVYATPRVVHTQYMATTHRGREIKALALLIDRLKELYARTHDYLDFGVSTEAGGSVLNRGLLLQKSGQGGLGVVYAGYELRMEK